MSNFTKKAKNHVSGSPILQGRNKVATDELIAAFPDGVTIRDFDFLSGKNGRYVVCAFEESPDLYFNGGKILSEIFEEFLEDYTPDDGSMSFRQIVDACRADFVADGGIKVKMSKSRTKDGNTVTLVDIVD